MLSTADTLSVLLKAQAQRQTVPVSHSTTSLQPITSPASPMEKIKEVGSSQPPLCLIPIRSQDPNTSVWQASAPRSILQSIVPRRLRRSARPLSRICSRRIKRITHFSTRYLILRRSWKRRSRSSPSSSVPKRMGMQARPLTTILRGRSNCLRMNWTFRTRISRKPWRST